MKKFLIFSLLLLLFVPFLAFASVEHDNVTTDNVENLITGQELKTKSISGVAEIYGIDAKVYAKELGKIYGASISPSDSFQLLHDNYGVEPSVAKDVALAVLNDDEVVASDFKKDGEPTYHLVWISVGLLILYVLSRFLVKKKVISLLTYRNLWNLLLLFSFFIAGLLGIFLVLKVNFGWVFPLPFNILFWHVELGIAMFIMVLFHLSERMFFFKQFFRKRK